MALYYSTAQAARLAEINKVAENGYCLGFMVSEWVGNDHFETMYAIKGDTILMHRHKASNNFDHPLYKWEKVTNVPTNAEWIGTYEMPTKIKG
ncbi:hypothetical protein D3C87_324770 [compost metagenome]